MHAIIHFLLVKDVPGMRKAYNYPDYAIRLHACNAVLLTDDAVFQKLANKGQRMLSGLLSCLIRVSYQ